MKEQAGLFPVVVVFARPVQGIPRFFPAYIYTLVIGSFALPPWTDV